MQAVAVLGGGQGGHGPRPRAFFDQKGPRKRAKNAKYSIDKGFAGGEASGFEGGTR